MNKTGKILAIYDRLRNNQSIKKEIIMIEFNICDATFENYMSEIRCHLSNSYNLLESLVIGLKIIIE